MVVHVEIVPAVATAISDACYTVSMVLKMVVLR